MNSTEEERKIWRELFHRDYKKHRDARLKRIKERNQKRRAFIIQELGGRCVVCGATDPLVIHHVDYDSCNPYSTLKSLKANKLVLLCRKHHRAVHYVNELQRAGYLEKVLKLLNINRRPRKGFKKLKKDLGIPEKREIAISKG